MKIGIFEKIWLGLCKLENEILNGAKNAENSYF